MIDPKTHLCFRGIPVYETELLPEGSFWRRGPNHAGTGEAVYVESGRLDEFAKIIESIDEGETS